MCLSPIVVKTKDSFGIDVNQSVPCGKCIECLKDSQNSWKIRLSEEARDHKYVYFFTLTYNDESVPFIYDDDGNKVLHFRKSDVQLWLKRHRMSFERYFKRKIDFKYFICSEYGPNTGRPHFHGILFTDISPTFISKMFNDWSDLYGYTNFSEVGKCGKQKTRSNISTVGNYVAKYCLKPPRLRTDAEIRVDRLIKIGILPPTFKIMSKGIGCNYINRMKRYHVPTTIRSPSERISVVCDRAFYHDGSFKYKLPRFFRDRLYREKFPFDARVWNPKLKCYENKTIYRYASKNMLSRQMQVEIRNRILAEYNKTFRDFKSRCPSKSDDEIHLEIERSAISSRSFRQADIYSKMSRFYNYQRFKNRKF